MCWNSAPEESLGAGVLNQAVQSSVFRVDELCSQSFGVFGSSVGVRRGAERTRQVCDDDFRGGGVTRLYQDLFDNSVLSPCLASVG